MIGHLQRYVVGDVSDHDTLRRKIQDIKFDYKEIASGITSDIRARQVRDLDRRSDTREHFTWRLFFALVVGCDAGRWIA